MNRPRKQGTAWESAFVASATDHGLQARRLPEGGSADEGDVELVDHDGDRWVIECRHRERMNIHRALAKARAKAFGGLAAVAWKRTVAKAGNTRRSADGEPVIVALTLDAFLELASGVVASKHRVGDLEGMEPDGAEARIADRLGREAAQDGGWW